MCTSSHSYTCTCNHASLQVSVDSATLYHPTPNLRLSSFLACTLTFFWFHYLWFCSRIYSFPTVSLSLPILLTILISRQVLIVFIVKKRISTPHVSLNTTLFAFSSWGRVLWDFCPFLELIPSLSFSFQLVSFLSGLVSPDSMASILVKESVTDCQAMSNGLDKGICPVILSEALDWSWR